MRRNALVMVHLGRRDATALRRVMMEHGLAHDSVDDSPRPLEDLRRYFAEAVRDGATARLLPLLAFASFHGDQTLALEMLRALGPTQNLHALWRPALSAVRQQPGFGDIVQQLGLVDYWRLSGNWGEFCHGTPSGGFACQ